MREVVVISASVTPAARSNEVIVSPVLNLTSLLIGFVFEESCISELSNAGSWFCWSLAWEKLCTQNVKTKRVSRANQDTPIIIGHGIKDDVIPIEKSKIAYNQLLKEGANVKFHKYSGGHKISMNYFREILKVING